MALWGGKHLKIATSFLLCLSSGSDGLRTATGLTFKQRRVQSLRVCYHIPAGGMRPASDEPLYTAEKAARELGVSPQTIHDWLRAGLVRGQQPMAGAPWRITLDDETRRKLTGKDAPQAGSASTDGRDRGSAFVPPTNRLFAAARRA